MVVRESRETCEREGDSKIQSNDFEKVEVNTLGTLRLLKYHNQVTNILFADYFVDCFSPCMLLHQRVKQMSSNYREVMVYICYHGLSCKLLVSYF